MRTFSARRMSPSYYPDSVLTKLVYNFPLVTWSSLASSTISDLLISGNTVELPIAGVSATIPPGYTNMWNVYNKYICYGSKLNITFYNNNPGTAGQTEMIVSVTPLDADTSVGTVTNNTELEFPYCKYRVLGAVNSSSGRVRINHYMTSAKMSGIDFGKDIEQSAVTMNTTTPGGTAAYTPLALWNWKVSATVPASYAVSATTYPNLTMRLTYYVRFFDRKFLTK